MNDRPSLRVCEGPKLPELVVLTFAEKIITSPTRLRLESSIDQRRRLQKTLFPDGLIFEGQEFRTPSNSSFFDMLGAVLGGESQLASPTGFEPVLSP
jgi:hypothetical protein